MKIRLTLKWMMSVLAVVVFPHLSFGVTPNPTYIDLFPEKQSVSLNVPVTASARHADKPFNSIEFQPEYHYLDGVFKQFAIPVYSLGVVFHKPAQNYALFIKVGSSFSEMSLGDYSLVLYGDGRTAVMRSLSKFALGGGIRGYFQTWLCEFGTDFVWYGHSAVNSHVSGLEFNLKLGKTFEWTETWSASPYGGFSYTWLNTAKIDGQNYRLNGSLTGFGLLAGIKLDAKI
jgi:hypothetical protein